MTVLVTGASGFIGRHFVEYLEDRGIDFIESNIRYPYLEHPYLIGISSVVHLAGVAHNKAVNDAHFYQINCDFPVKLALAAKKSGVRLFIYISSVNVYDISQSQPFKESSPTNCNGHFVKSKLDAERNLLDLSGDEFNVIIIRCPLVYGINAPANFSKIMSFASRFLILPFGVAKSYRSYLSIGNLCSALEVCLISYGSNSGIYNVSDGVDMNMNDLTTFIRSGSGKKVLQLPINESIMKSICKVLGLGSIFTPLFTSLQIDVNYFRRQFNWDPTETPEEAIKKIWMKND